MKMPAESSAKSSLFAKKQTVTEEPKSSPTATKTAKAKEPAYTEIKSG